MATEGLRRSGRARKQVQSYAEEQAAETAKATAAAITAKNVKNSAPKKPVQKKRKKVEVEQEEESDEEEELVEQPPKKRGKKNSTTAAKGKKIDGVKGQSWISEAAEKRIAREEARIPSLARTDVEKRLRSYINGPPEWYERFLKSASTQKMFVLDRTRDVEEDCHANHDDCPFESLRIAGHSGSVYTVRISHLTSCTCPVGVFTKRNEVKQCKHVLYVLHHVLKAPDHLKYQPAFLTAELKELFANAPPLPSQIVEEQVDDGKRKSLDDAECPICYMELEEDDEIVWCKAACGNNLHKGCFDQWAKIKANVTCPLCRTPWESDKAGKKNKTTIAEVNEGSGRYDNAGYLNVRDQLDYDDDDD